MQKTILIFENGRFARLLVHFTLAGRVKTVVLQSIALKKGKRKLR
jgi:hypothetical protein